MSTLAAPTQQEDIMAVLRNDVGRERRMALALGIDPTDVKAGSLVAESDSSHPHTVIVSWECVKTMPLDEFNKIVNEHWSE